MLDPELHSLTLTTFQDADAIFDTVAKQYGYVSDKTIDIEPVDMSGRLATHERRVTLWTFEGHGDPFHRLPVDHPINGSNFYTGWPKFVGSAETQALDFPLLPKVERLRYKQGEQALQTVSAPGERCGLEELVYVVTCMKSALAKRSAH
jgi:hypothetical protein